MESDEVRTVSGQRENGKRKKEKGESKSRSELVVT